MKGDSRVAKLEVAEEVDADVGKREEAEREAVKEIEWAGMISYRKWLLN